MSPRHRAPLLLGHALVALIAALAVLGACSAQPASTSSGGGGVAVAMPPGEAVYVGSCSKCHGVDRMGKRDAPKLDAVRISSLGEQPLRMTIQYGKGRMEAFGGLSQQQVDDLVAFLRGS